MDTFSRTLMTRNGLELRIDLAKYEQLDEVCEFLRLHFFSTERIVTWLPIVEQTIT